MSVSWDIKIIQHQMICFWTKLEQAIFMLIRKILAKKFRNFSKFRPDMPQIIVYYLHNAFPVVSNMLYSYSSKTFLVVSFAFISFFNSSDWWTNQKWFWNLPGLFVQCSFSDFQLSNISKISKIGHAKIIGPNRCWWRMLVTKCVVDNFEMLITD